MMLLLVLALFTQQATISGRLIDDAGAPLAARVVELQSRYGTSLSPRLQASSDADGSFVLTNVKPGTWRIRIYTQPGASSFSLLTDSFDLEAGHRTLDVVIPAVPVVPANIQPGVGYAPVPAHDRPGAPMVAGALVDVQSLEPVRDATIHFYRVGDDNLSDPLHTTASNDVGYFEVNTLAESTFQVRVIADGYHEVNSGALKISGSARMVAHLLNEDTDHRSWSAFRPLRATAVWGDGSSLAVILNPTVRSPWGSLSGHLRYEWGHSPNAMVELMRPDGTPLHRFLDARVEADGSFSIHSIAPSTYLLRVTIDDRVIDIPNVDIQAGANELTVAL